MCYNQLPVFQARTQTAGRDKRAACQGDQARRPEKKAYHEYFVEETYECG
jgi:hypothetical protein